MSAESSAKPYAAQDHLHNPHAAQGVSDHKACNTGSKETYPVIPIGNVCSACDIYMIGHAGWWANFAQQVLPKQLPELLKLRKIWLMKNIKQCRRSVGRLARDKPRCLCLPTFLLNTDLHTLGFVMQGANTSETMVGLGTNIHACA